MSLWSDIKDDPTGAGLAIAVPALVVLCVAAVFASSAPITPPKPAVAVRKAPPRAPEKPPAAWRASAKPGDVMSLGARPVAYWGRPDATYSVAATAAAKPFACLIVHFTAPPFGGMSAGQWAVQLVKMQHEGDKGRGGLHFGYHFYVDSRADIRQGAPLSVRTNHIKGRAHPKRKPGPSLACDNTNSVAVTMVGGCVAVGRGLNMRCMREELSPDQHAAGRAVVDALLAKFRISPCRVFGHGELQEDRASFEGETLAREVRTRCVE